MLAEESESRRRIRRLVEESGRKVVVLDDDPTGVQSVHGVPVLTTWDTSDLTDALRDPSSVFFILTNSRSFPEEEAKEINREIALNLCAASDETGVDFEVVSRSDSTLRGHFPAETDALSEVLSENGRKPDAVIVCPAFFEAGKVTAGDVHYVVEGDGRTPVSQTEFARDHSFGYRSSDLKEWIEEKSGGRTDASEVVSISLDDLRSGGAGRVREVLDGLKPDSTAIVNAESYDDLDVFVSGLLEAISGGRRFLYRSGPSFVQPRGGISAPVPLGRSGLQAHRDGHGLVLVGSYVRMTTRQLESALMLGGVHAVELSVSKLLGDGRREELDRVVGEVNDNLPESDVVVYTSRELIKAGNIGRSNFEIGASTSEALVEIMRRVDRDAPLSFVVAKGGITSSDIATKGLGVRRAEVLGPLLEPGIVPVWKLGDDGIFPGLPYIVFPGNVGGPDALREAIEILRR